MPSTAQAALAAVADEVAKPVTGDDDLLTATRKVVGNIRSMEAEKRDLEERVAQLGRDINDLRQKRLPELFTQARITELTIEPQGNQPAYTAQLKPFYKANIAADWDEDRKDTAFDALEEHGGGELIKRTFTLEVGLRDADTANEIRKVLDGHDLDYTEQRGVPWATLTAWVKDRTESKKTLPPLDVIGAETGQFVEVKPVKPKKGKGK